jgi:calbindin D28
MAHTSHANVDHRRTSFLSKLSEAKPLNSIDLIKIWTCYDKDASGYLEQKELDCFLRDLMTSRSSEPVTDAMLAEFRTSVLQEIDTNKDGKVELGEFASMMPMEENFLKKYTGRKSLSRQHFDEIFEHYDPDGNGYIDGKELMALIRDIMTKVDDQVSVKEIQDFRETVLKVYDKNADGKLSKKELGLLLSIDKS